MTDQSPRIATVPMKVKLLSAIKEARYLPRTLRLVWTAAGRWTIAWAALLVFQGLLPIAVVYLVRAVVNALVAASAAGGDWPHFRGVLFIAAPLGAIMLLAKVLDSLMAWIRTVQADLVSCHIADLIHQKCGEVDMAFYETPAFFDKLYQARADAANRPLALLENMGGLVQSGVTLVGMAAVLIPFGFWLPLLLVFGALPAVYRVFRSARMQYAWRATATPIDRRAHYFNWLLTSAPPAAEVRLFGTEGHFRRTYQDLLRRLHLGNLALMRRERLGELYAGGLSLVITGTALSWIVWRALRGLIVLGDLALFYQAFSKGQQMVGSLLGNTQQLCSNLLFVGKLYEFLALEPKVVSPSRPVPMPPLRRGIRFEQVSFHYPGSDRAALQNFNLEVPAGRITAILGANGSGKSTLVKLLCRLYDPDAGRIAIDGVDLRDVSLKELRSSISPLFQMPIQYSTTVAENIALGDLSGSPTADRIRAAARAAGADEVISRLPGGYDCVLGTGFENGTEVSVGEWQRIALARAFLRPTPILVLDEPTSAMDSWAETDWLDRFWQLAQGRTAVVITHRLSTAMRADTICIMEHGRVVESGSHGELLAAGKRYAAAWASQTKEVSRGSGLPDPLQTAG